MPRLVLCLNSGSSSIKAAVYDVGSADPRRRAHVLVEGLGPDDAAHARGIDEALHRLGTDVALDDVAAIGHRVVHGGPHLVEHTAIDDDVMATLRAAVEFAPLHLPAELAGIESVGVRFPDVAQVACLDTAFHRTMPEVATRYALPAWVADRGVRRFGFHGLSYEYIVATVGAGALGRAVIAHLGSGASLAAIEHGRSVDTTMGLTPTGGIVMGTRPGDLDPGVVEHLLRSAGLDLDALAHLLDHESGLLGLSGTTADVRDLLAARTAGDRPATLALEVFARSVRKGIGAFAAVLGGIDTLVFTGGVGEHAAPLRAEIVAGLAHLGLTLDATANDRSARVISGARSTGRVLVVPTDEEVMIARHTARLTDADRGRSGP